MSLKQKTLKTAPRPKVLIVDDQPVNIRVLHELLREDHDIYMASNGASAIAKCHDLLPDLVLLDVVMEGIDGYEVCRQLKADPITAQIPIIFVTAYFDEVDEVRGFELGAADFIHKPINPLITQMRVRNQLLLKKQTDQLRAIALNDGLTGIANRRKFDATLETQWQHCQRTVQPLSLLMLDVDFFKLYNDHYGHQQGDTCLQEIASTLQESLQRPLDLVARYGGEEFAAILPHTNLDGAKHLGEQILNNVRKLGLEHQNSAAADTVTLSIGIACSTPSKKGSIEDLIKAADEQLYHAKEAGRAQLSAIDMDQLLSKHDSDKA